MDEDTLNDLLECSVCLDRLDTSSKVLPCQHTFCRKCLDVIYSSRRELRCPECRVLVNASIDELPPNVLLMRILGGLQSAKSTSQTKSVSTTKELDVGEEQRNYSRHNETHESNGQHQLSSGNSTNVIQNRTTNTHNSCGRGDQGRSPVSVPHAFALNDFTSRDLSFKKGDLVLLKRQIDANWYVGGANGNEGSFPLNYVQVAIPLPTPTPQCVARFDFKMGPNEEEGCLRFQRGTIIHVIRRIDKNWAEGRIGSNIGIFPIDFVSLNTLAKQLLEGNVSAPTSRGANQQPSQPQQPQQTSQTRNLPPIPLLDPTSNSHANDSTSSSSSLATTSPNSANTTTSSTQSSAHSTPGTPNQSLPNTPQHNASNSVRFRHNAHKRHSLNALLGAGNPVTPTLSVLQTNRHSAEILSMPDEHTPSASGARPYDMRTDVRSLFGLNSPQASVAAIEQQALMPSNSNGRASVLQSLSGRPNLPWSYVALYPYKPHKADELELKKGCVYIVTERCRDGWFKGKDWQDVSGVFPGNYVIPLRTRDQQQLIHQLQFIPPPEPSDGITAASNNPASLTNATTLNHHDFAKPHTASVQLQPPDLPPRCPEQAHQRQQGASAASSQVRIKPLSLVQKIDNLFVDGNCAAGNKKQKIAQQNNLTPKEPNNKNTPSATTSSSVAANLFKRLSSIKSRSKSPHQSHHDSDAIQQPEESNEQTPQRYELQSSVEKEHAPTNNIHPVHVRSGSCPSKFAQSAPVDPPQQAQPQKSATQVTYGSQRVKGCKERTSCLHSQPTIMTPTFQQHQVQPLQQQHQVQPPQQQVSQAQASTLINLLFSKHSQQEHNYAANQHRKSQSLDAGNILTAPPMPSPNDQMTNQHSRVRCVVPYPPNSDIELELQIGDVIYVERKLKNGWYKGTSLRNAKTGLFPATFVEPDY